MKTRSRTTIPNPYGYLPVTERHGLQTYVDPETYNFFTKYVFCGTPGALSAALATLIQKLHDECKRRGIGTSGWDLSNESRVIEILADISFTRRPDHAPAVASAQSTRQRRNPRAAPSAPSANPSRGDITPNAQRNASA